MSLHARTLNSGYNSLDLAAFIVPLHNFVFSSSTFDYAQLVNSVSPSFIMVFIKFYHQTFFERTSVHVFTGVNPPFGSGSSQAPMFCGPLDCLYSKTDAVWKIECRTFP